MPADLLLKRAQWKDTDKRARPSQRKTQTQEGAPCMLVTKAAAHALYPTAENEDGRPPTLLGEDFVRDVINGDTSDIGDDPA